MTNHPINYFTPARTALETMIRRIKGDYRKAFIAEAIKQDGLESIPSQWLEHELDETFKLALMSRGPRNRGGEDLPDLEDGEVEVARLSLANSVHGEVTSLRACSTCGQILLRLVDEYQTEFELPHNLITVAFSAAELVEFFAACKPCPLETDCQLRIASPFYEGLQELLDARLEREGSDDE